MKFIGYLTIISLTISGHVLMSQKMSNHTFEQETVLTKQSFLSNDLTGDFILTSFFRLEKNKGKAGELGWKIKEDNGWVTASLLADGTCLLKWSSSKDSAGQIISVKKDYDILQLIRKGQEFIMRGAHIGEPMQELASVTHSGFSTDVKGGLFFEKDKNTQLRGFAWNTSIDLPVDDSYRAYQEGLLTARLEILDIETLKRKVIYTSETGFEAPNWLADNQLLFNQEGLIYKIPAVGGEPKLVNTGEINQSNNDHVVSWSGQQLAISSGSEGFSSRIYILPIDGGIPQLITPKAPSYLHGWSTDDKNLIYTAKRGDDDFNLFSIDIATQKETQLTFNKGLTDGPEYSPDGKYVYYNGTQSGTMQVWRMKPDGSNPEQLTFDEKNDWFPHISPDNQWIVFVSFPTSVSPLDHPHYQHVEIRMMPVAGGAPRTIAYLYGGQGTMNVPSWSPDSRKIAFVSFQGRVK